MHTVTSPPLKGAGGDVFDEGFKKSFHPPSPQFGIILQK